MLHSAPPTPPQDGPDRLFAGLVGRWIPPEIEAQGPDAVTRARILVGLVLALPLLTLAVGVLYRILGKPLEIGEIAAHFGALATLAFLPLLRWTGAITLCGNLLMGSLVILSFGAAATSGGEQLLPLQIAAVVPPVTVLLCGPRSGIAWAGLLCAATGVVGFGVEAGWQFPRSIPLEVQVRSRFVSTILTTTLVTGLVLIYERARRRSNAELARSRGDLAVSEERFRTVFDEATVGIALVGADGLLFALNPAGRQFLPIQIGDRFAGKLEEWLSEEDMERVLAHTAEVIAGASPGRIELLFGFGGGRCEWVNASVVPVGSDDGALSFYVCTLDRVTDRKHAEQQMHALAYFDSLTGLPNRQSFRDRLKHEVELAATRDETLALLFVDLDGFKEVNDRFGHETGDEVLALVSERLAESVRLRDQIGRATDESGPDPHGVSRLGGDEFTVVLPRIHHRQGAAVVAERILNAISAPVQIGNERVTIAASVGIAMFPEDATDPAELLRLADVAMYSEKRSGRCRYRFATDDDHDHETPVS